MAVLMLAMVPAFIGLRRARNQPQAQVVTALAE
jgi:hypothetical protein